MDEDMYTFEATVATGFETILSEEIKKKIPSSVYVSSEKRSGRVLFNLPLDNCAEIFSLKGADNVSLLLTKRKEVSFSNDKAADLELLGQLPEDINWSRGLNAWLKAIDKENTLVQNVQSFAQEKCTFFNSPSIELHDIVSVSDPTSISDYSSNIEKNISFRVSCNRNGKSHSFTSQEAATAFGGAIKDRFNWKVDLKNYEIEILLYINDSSYYACIGLTRMSLHFRNLTVCGKLSLRPTVAYNILRLASIQQGDIVCDPMAGFGTIPIEAAMEFPLSHVLCGDVNAVAVEQCAINISSLNKRLELNNKKILNLSTFRWDAFCLPLRNNTVDVIVTDLPFGKWCGRKSSLPFVYENVVREMTRICRAKSGRCVLMVMNHKILSKAMGKFKEFWCADKVIPINLGNLSTKVCLFNRKDKNFPEL